PDHLVTDRNNNMFLQRLGNPNQVAYVDDQTFGSNRIVRVVFLSNTNDAAKINVFFPNGFDEFFYGDIVVEWSASLTNSLGVTNNYLYLFDSLLLDQFSFLVLHGFAGSPFALSRPTFIPLNFLGPIQVPFYP